MSHKTENILKFLLNNPPKIPKIGITKFRGTNKYDMFQYVSKDPVECARYNYAEMKCANDNGYSVIRIVQLYFNDKKNIWYDKLSETIKKIINEKIVQNIYICENNEYNEYNEFIYIFLR